MTSTTNHHNGHAVRALFARPAAIVSGFGSRAEDVARAQEVRLAPPPPDHERDGHRVARQLGYQPAAIERYYRLASQAALAVAEARDHAQTVREAQGQQEVGHG